MPPTDATPPQTVWECCLAWADLLIRRHLDTLEQDRDGRLVTLSEDENALYAGLDKPLVTVLIAAALHERILHLELSLDDAVFVPLAAPQEEGVTGTLRRSAAQALDISPDIEPHGGPSRAVLAHSAHSPHPDERALWDRVRTAALTVVDAVARRTQPRHTGPRHPNSRADGPYWERGSTIGDVLLAEQRRHQMEQLAAAWSDED